MSAEVKCLGRNSCTLCVISPLVIRQAIHPEASKKVTHTHTHPSLLPASSHHHHHELSNWIISFLCFFFFFPESCPSWMFLFICGFEKRIWKMLPHCWPGAESHHLLHDRMYLFLYMYIFICCLLSLREWWKKTTTTCWTSLTPDADVGLSAVTEQLMGVREVRTMVQLVLSLLAEPYSELLTLNLKCLIFRIWTLNSAEKWWTQRHRELSHHQMYVSSAVMVLAWN